MKYTGKDIERMLYDYKVLKATNNNRKMELEDVETGVGSPELDWIGGKTNQISSVVEHSVVNNFDRRESLRKDLEADEKMIRIIENGLSALTSIERKIVEAKYFERMQWWEVATEVKFSDERCRQIKRDALMKLIQVLNI
ncbi:MAG: sigma factor-like helix-turn-helix DNA-binding protein [Peptostreptococcaceae bacterium]|nr:sigma factor-like helix-turn-helix DNA-binding protein [Peptostreptococcaceae bacterium]